MRSSDLHQLMAGVDRNLDEEVTTCGRLTVKIHHSFFMD